MTRKSVRRVRPCPTTSFGLVRDVSGNPMAGAAVSFAASTEGAEPASATSDASGRVSALDLAPPPERTTNCDGRRFIVARCVLRIGDRGDGRLEFVSQPAATAYTMYPLDRVPRASRD